MILMMESDDSITGPINIGNPNEISINNLAHIILNLTNSKSKIINIKISEDDPKKRKPDIKLANSTLNWSPKISLIDGLKLTVNYFKNFSFKIKKKTL